MAGTDLFNLDGQVALVTGASRGLGLAMATAMAEAGATVVLNGRDPTTLEAAAARLRDAGHQADTAPFDVGDEAAARAGVDAAIERHGRLDILICNAGVQHRKPFLEWETSDFRRVVEINLTSCFVLAQQAARHMVPRGSGRIIMTASIMSQLARPTVHAYVAAKSGLWGLTRSLAAELGPLGLTANAIAPGFYGTEMNTALVNNPEFTAWVESRVPLGRWGEPEEIGGAAVFLAAEAGAYVNGHMLLVDGGLTAVL